MSHKKDTRLKFFNRNKTFHVIEDCSDFVESGRLRINSKVQVGKDQEKAQSERDSHSKSRGGKKPN